MVQEIIGRLLSETAAESTSTTTETTHHTDHRLGNYIVLYIMLALLAGQILKHIANSFKIPYTPMLALFGISVGFATNYLDHWGTGSEAISGIDPHLFLLIFLPPLIFESAFSIDWHIIKAEILQILILAGP